MDTLEDRTLNQAEFEAVEEMEEAGHNLSAIEAFIGNSPTTYQLVNWEEWIDDFEEAYQGEMTTKEFAEQLADEAIPEYAFNDRALDFITMYFDYDKFERDLFMGDYWERNGFIFRAI